MSVDARSVPARERDVRVIAARGELDAEACALLWIESWAALAEGPAGLIMDLSRTAGSESGAVATVIAAAKACRSGGGAFVLVAGDSPIRAVVHTCGLDRRLTVSANLAGALALVEATGSGSARLDLHGRGE